jgi:hypothetical protein
MFLAAGPSSFLAHGAGDQLSAADPGYLQLRKSPDGVKCDPPETPADKKAACDKCKQGLERERDRMQQAYRRATDHDNVQKALGADCPVLNVSNQRGGHTSSNETNRCGEKTQLARQTIADELKREAKECKKNVDAAKCDGSAGSTAQQAGRDAKQGCKKMEEAADKARNARGNEAKEMGKNGGESKDNEKKGESAGGMPQMPQMPQQQQGQETPQQQPADYPTATSPTPDSENKPEQVAASKFDEDKDKTAIPAVGFGNTTPTDTATVTAPGNSFTAQGIDPNLRGLASNLGSGDDKQASVAASASPPGGGGGGGLGGNSSGASSPGPGATAEKTPDPNNPYEVPVGSGGRLGAPKGKTGGESDTALDAAATANFKDDFKSDGGGGGSGELAGAGEEEDPGYTIFKMVRYRYVELKKKGNI